MRKNQFDLPGALFTAAKVASTRNITDIIFIFILDLKKTCGENITVAKFTQKLEIRSVQSRDHYPQFNYAENRRLASIYIFPSAQTHACCPCALLCYAFKPWRGNTIQI